jgi:hypothetical protein
MGLCKFTEGQAEEYFKKCRIIEVAGKWRDFGGSLSYKVSELLEPPADEHQFGLWGLPRWNHHLLAKVNVPLRNFKGIECDEQVAAYSTMFR